MDDSLVDFVSSDRDAGRSIGSTGDDGAFDGLLEASTGGSGGNGRFGALIDLLFGGGNGAILGVCDPVRSGLLDELVPGRRNAGLGGKGWDGPLIEDPAKDVSASQVFFSTWYTPQLLPSGADTSVPLSGFRLDFLVLDVEG
jgi:hypothetical protein